MGNNVVKGDFLEETFKLGFGRSIMCDSSDGGDGEKCKQKGSQNEKASGGRENI